MQESIETFSQKTKNSIDSTHYFHKDHLQIKNSEILKNVKVEYLSLSIINSQDSVHIYNQPQSPHRVTLPPYILHVIFNFAVHSVIQHSSKTQLN